MLMLNVPATIGLIVLAMPIVRLLFEHGRFLPADTEATAAALRLYAIGLIGYSAARIASPVFYALGRSRVPVAVSIAAIAVNVVRERRAGRAARIPRAGAQHVAGGARARRRAARRCCAARSAGSTDAGSPPRSSRAQPRRRRWPAPRWSIACTG